MNPNETGPGPCAHVRKAAPADRPAVNAMLARLNLPLAGVAEWFDHFWVADTGGEIVGAAGVELYDKAALLRSVAVAPEWRGTGLGRALVDQALDAARDAGALDVYLLTTTAEQYFPRFGFACIERSEVPDAVRGSVEFRSACPDSALAMWRKVG